MATAMHESAHACAGLHFGLRVRSVSIAPPKGLTSFQRDNRFRDLSPRKRCIISMAGEVGEAKYTGEALCIPYQRILQEMKCLLQGDSVPTSDTRNIASQIAIETGDEAMARWLIDRRVGATQKLVAENWADISRVADALLVAEQLDQAQIDHLIGRHGSTTE